MPKRKSNLIAGLLPSNIGYVYVRDFGAAKCVADAVHHTLARAGPLNGLILDLRDTKGDLMHDGIKFAALFIESGELWSYSDETRDGPSKAVVSLHDDCFEWVGQRGGSQQRRCTWQRHPWIVRDMPVIVLVNHETGAAGQVLADVLKRHKIAGVWGAPTSGAGVPTGFFTFQPNGKSLALVSNGRIDLKGEWRSLVGRESLVIDKDLEYPCQVTNAFDNELVIRAGTMLSLAAHGKLTEPMKVSGPKGKSSGRQRRRRRA
jgi:C-terminal processing protease CtpA/Prc